MLRFVLAAVVCAALCPFPGAAQSYNDVEANVRRQLEADRARTIGNCGEAMVSWLGMRFSEVDRRNGKAHDACAAAQMFSSGTGFRS